MCFVEFNATLLIACVCIGDKQYKSIKKLEAERDEYKHIAEQLQSELENLQN